MIPLFLCGIGMSAADAQLPKLQAERPTAAPQPFNEGLVEKTVQYDKQSPVRYEILRATGPAVYIVQLEGSPLASYRGDIPGLAATSPAVTDDKKLDLRTSASRAYSKHLADKRDAVLDRMKTRFDRKIMVLHIYDVAYNGVAVELTPEEAVQVVSMPGVRQVIRNFERYIETDVTPDFLNAVSIWDGSAIPSGDGVVMGESVVVGIIDTGINMDHRSFAVTADDGYTHTNPRAQYYGWCNPGHPEYDAALPCNDKLIGVYSYPGSGDNPEDDHSHGSHVGSTAAGNVLYDVVYAGVTLDQISGMAPRANIIAYDVCQAAGGCDIVSILAAIDDATTDQVDVINYSIGGGPQEPWGDPDSEAFLAARDAGIFVATSAGNSGPGAGTVGSPGNSPWMTTVGNSTIGRVFTNTLDVTGPETVPGELTGIAAVPGEGGPPILANISGDIRYAGDVAPGNELGCSPFPAGAFNGSIALIQRGNCNFSVKVDNAKNAGAIAVVVFDHSGGPPMTMGGLEGTTIPAVFITKADGEAVRDWIQAETGPTARINAGTSRVVNPDWADIMSSTSSRGPNVNPSWIKPDIAAPGTNIFAAYMGGLNNFGMMSGTSMASPHVAGAAALLREHFPGWTPAEVQSALMMTSRYDTVVKQDAVTPADAFDQGAGRLDLTAAALTGLVLDETTANFEAANPALGGDPKTLNLASMANHNCAGTCTWTRTVRSVLDDAADYTLSGQGPVGMNFTFNPSSFTIPAGGTQEIEITVDVTALPVDVLAFGRVLLETDALHPSENPVADNHMPVVVIPREGAPVIDVDPDQITSTQAPDTMVDRTLTINNTGSADLQWEIFTGEAGTPGAPVEMIIDDGSLENNIGIGGTAQFIFLNRFTPLAGSFPITLNQIQVYFDTTGIVNIGDDMRLVVYENTSANPDPAVGANLLATVDVTVTALDAWNTYDLAAPVMLNGPGDVLIGVIALEIPGTSYWPAAMDQTASRERSWAGWWNTATAPTPPTLPPDAGWTLIDAYFPGNWMIRGFGTGIGTPCGNPSPVAWLSLSPTDGTTAPGAGTPVTVTFDSTGLAFGNYEALLCIASNDPVNNQVLVPITLNVAESAIPNIDVDPLSISSTQPENTFTSQAMSIANTGTGDLTWDIAQEPTAGSPPEALTGGNSAAARDIVSPSDGREGTGVPAPLTDWAMPQAIAYDNGLLVTHPGGGFGGADASALQTALGLNTYGFGAQVSNGNRVADDFTIGGSGLAVTTITFFAYQNGSTTTSTIDQVNMRIWDGPPNDPGSLVVFGDTTTNRLVSSTWTNIYRVRDDILTDNTRPIMTVVAEVNTFLPPGTYWVDWQVNGTLTSGPWIPPVTILGQTGKPGANALQYIGSGWGAVIDSGVAAAPQDLPFIVDGEDSCANLANVPWLSTDPSSGVNAAGTSTEVTVGLDSTGLAPAVYTANLCIFCNDPDPGPGNGTELVVVPVTLEVTEVPPAPAITLTKTVGTVVGVCAGTDEITVPAGTTVYYCYTVTNTGNITLNLHDLVDDQLGTIFSGLTYALAPGASVNTVDAGLTLSAVINADTTNTATWTAYNTGPVNQVTAEASATVWVEIPVTVAVEVGPSGGGTVAGGGVFNIGDSVTVEAFPDPGWTFVHWENSPNPPIPDNPYTFTVTGDITLTAVFARELAGTPIPTLSEWGMILMLLLLSGSAVWMIRRRRIS